MAVMSKTRGTLRPDPAEFLMRAEAQLVLANEAYDQGDLPRAVVYAYRAGLRAAGAVIDAERPARRRLPAGSAWLRLRAVRPDLGGWADSFEQHARLAERADIGLERDVADSAFQEVYSDSVELLERVRMELGLGLQAA